MSDRGRGAREGFRPSAKQIGGGILALLAVIFVLQNTQDVRIHLLGWHVTAQLWVVLIVMFALGAGAKTLLRWHGRRRD
jgi:uncharacterized integral membrane protein